MRDRALRRLITAAALAAAVCAGSLRAPARADTATRNAVRVTIEAPQALRAGDHVNLGIVVELGAASDSPLTLTPSIEGNAVEAVRGRLLRADAKSLDAGRLRFELPVIARSEGTAIVHVELSTYVCEPRCRYTVTRASQVLRVRSAGAP